MLHVLGLIALAIVAQADVQPTTGQQTPGQSGAGQWQDFGVGQDGVRVSVNLDSIEQNGDGAEAMVRLRNTRIGAPGAVQQDILYTFNCSNRSATRRLYVEERADGTISARSDEGEALSPVQIPEGAPITRVRGLVCATVAG